MTNFAVVYEGFLDVPVEGSWTFTGQVNDRCHVWIGGLQAIDDLTDGGHDVPAVTLHLAKGLHPFRLEFVQKGGSFGFRLDWSGPGQPSQQIPASAFRRMP